MTRPYLLDLMEIAYRDEGMSAALAVAEAEFAREREREVKLADPAIAFIALGTTALVAAVSGPLGWFTLATSAIGSALGLYVLNRLRAPTPPARP